MTEEVSTKTSSRSTCVAEPNSEVQTHRLGERLIGELFGYEHALLQRPYPSALSIAVELSTRLQRCDPANANYTALAPEPTLNRCLSRLVAILRAEYEPGRPVTEQLNQAVVQHVMQRLAAQPALAVLAASTRHIAGLAEAEMERHYSACLLEQLRRQPRATEQSNAHGVGAMQRLRRALSGFPYIDSYAHLVAAEVALLQQPVVPLFVRDRDRVRLPFGARRALAELQYELANYLQRASTAFPLQARGLAHATIAVCGCGPLPITGLMLHAAAGANVVMIDIDRHAIEQAHALVLELERVGALTPGAVTTRQGDAAELPFVAAASTERAPPDAVVCDGLIVASLVPHAAKVVLSRKLREVATPEPMALLMRSATGLSGELAYEPVRTLELSDLPLPFCGECVPANQVFTSLDANTAALRGLTSSASRELVGVSHSSVLNSSELYYRLPLPQRLALCFEPAALEHTATLNAAAQLLRGWS